MQRETVDSSLQKRAKIAGPFYFLIIAASILSMIFNDSNMTLPGDGAATVYNILAREPLFGLWLMIKWVQVNRPATETR